jgi:hypothetical protein
MNLFRVTAAAGVLLPLLTMGAVAQTVPPKPTEPPSIISNTVDMTVKVLNLDGATVSDGSVAKPKSAPADWAAPDLTFGRVIALVLCSDRPENKDKSESAADKTIRCNMGVSLMNDKAAILTAPQVSQIEDYLLLWPSNLVTAQIVNAIDPNVRHKAKP